MPLRSSCLSIMQTGPFTRQRRRGRTGWCCLEIYNGSATPLLTILREGIEELSGMSTGTEVLHYALKLTLSLSGGYAGYVAKKAEEDVWEIDGVKTLYIPKTPMEELSQKGGLYRINDELYRFFFEELQVK